MAVTALKTGCRLPIGIKPGAPKEIVQFIPPDLASVQPRKYIHTPLPPLLEEPGEAEPEVNDVY